MVRRFFQNIKETFERLEEAIKYTRRAYNTKMDIHKRCQSYRQPREVCNEIASEVLKNYDNYGLDTLLDGYVLNEDYKEILKNAIALGGPEIAEYIHGILTKFLLYGGRGYEKRIIPHVFQPLTYVDFYLRTMEYNKAKEALNHAEEQLFMLYNYLRSLPPQISKTAIKAIIQEIEKYNRPFWPDELVEIAEQTIKGLRFRGYK